MKITRTVGRLAAALLASLVVAAPAAAGPLPRAAEDGWTVTGEGITSGVSGVAVLEDDGQNADVLVVHDNKRTGQPRVSRIRTASPPAGTVPEVTVLDWVGRRTPVDLEALSEVPGRPGEFAALESSGRGYHLLLEGDSVRVLREFAVPGIAQGDNYEGFALGERAGRAVAVWAHRGQDEDPARLNIAALDWGTLTFGARQSLAVRVYDPSEHVRHISDVELSSTGRVIITSASDPGDDGPFDSTVHQAARIFTDLLGRPRLTATTPPIPLGTFPGHKIEALACEFSTAGVLGSDDENAGGSVRPGEVCPS